MRPITKTNPRKTIPPAPSPLDDEPDERDEELPLPNDVPPELREPLVLLERELLPELREPPEEPDERLPPLEKL